MNKIIVDDWVLFLKSDKKTFFRLYNRDGEMVAGIAQDRDLTCIYEIVPFGHINKIKNLHEAKEEISLYLKKKKFKFIDPKFRLLK